MVEFSERHSTIDPETRKQRNQYVRGIAFIWDSTERLTRMIDTPPSIGLLDMLALRTNAAGMLYSLGV